MNPEVSLVLHLSSRGQLGINRPSNALLIIWLSKFESVHGKRRHRNESTLSCLIHYDHDDTYILNDSGIQFYDHCKAHRVTVLNKTEETLKVEIMSYLY